MQSLSPLYKVSLCIAFVLTSLCSVTSFIAAQSCVQPPAGLVSWLPGDGNAQDIIGPNDGTLQGGTTFATGMVGQAFRLDGIHDYIRVPHHPSLNPASALTIEAWINSASTEGPRVIVSKWGNLDDSYIFKDHNDSDKLRIELSETVLPDLADLAGSTSIPLGTWVHVATTYDATEGTVRLYFNGREDASLFVGLGRLIHSSLTDVLIGAFEGTTEEGVIEHFAGLIDEVSIYNRALAAEEIQAIFNAGSAGKCKEPDNDGDGVPNDEDECPDSDLSATVVIDGCNTGVSNPLFPNGCTIADLLAACVEGARNHGQFVSCVAHVTNDLKKAGTISGQQKGAIQRCAAQADIP